MSSVQGAGAQRYRFRLDAQASARIKNPRGGGPAGAVRPIAFRQVCYLLICVKRGCRFTCWRARSAPNRLSLDADGIGPAARHHLHAEICAGARPRNKRRAVQKHPRRVFSNGRVESGLLGGRGRRIEVAIERTHIDEHTINLAERIDLAARIGTRDQTESERGIDAISAQQIDQQYGRCLAVLAQDIRAQDVRPVGPRRAASRRANAANSAWTSAVATTPSATASCRHASEKYAALASRSSVSLDPYPGAIVEIKKPKAAAMGTVGRMRAFRCRRIDFVRSTIHRLMPASYLLLRSLSRCSRARAAFRRWLPGSSELVIGPATDLGLTQIGALGSASEWRSALPPESKTRAARGRRAQFVLSHFAKYVIFRFASSSPSHHIADTAGCPARPRRSSIPPVCVAR